MTIVLVGNDPHGIGDAFQAQGAEVTAVEGLATGEKLATAGIDNAALFVLTDLDQATAIPVALDANPSLKVIVYDEQSLPEFVSAQTDLAIDPKLLAPSIVVEEVLATT